MLMAAGNIWLANMPTPKATFWPMETFDRTAVLMVILS
ncbi:MAG: Uncharacterised protein [Cryomorphaceae bacterium]|nr:MAG: Uncharacterised protein [Cryomorphaceae bacterium]